MSSSTLLHVGEDICRRIPVIESAGFAVLQTKIALKLIHAAFDGRDDFSAIVFQSDFHAPSRTIVHEIRTLSAAPFVLFENPAVVYDLHDFDLVIPVLTPLAVWLGRLSDVIEASVKLRELSLQLRTESQAARAKFKSLREQSARIRKRTVDPDAPWRGESR